MESEAASLVGQRSRSRIRPFFLHKPSSASEAVAAFESAGGREKAAYLAGGLDLVDRLKAGTYKESIIYLGGVSGLTGIAEEDGDLTIGALVTHAQFAADSMLRRRFPALAQEWASLANPRVRAVGTIGGNIMADNRNYDAIAVAMAADAELRFAQSTGVVTRKLDELREHGDLLLNIRIRQARKRKIVINRKFRPLIAFALSSLQLAAGFQFRLAVNTGFAHPAVSMIEIDKGILRLREADVAIMAGDLVAALPPPLDDWQASSRYRKDLLRTLVRRELLTRWGQL